MVYTKKSRTVASHTHTQLLRDLDYSDTVKVHVVCNGQEMPDFVQWKAADFLQ